MVNFADQPDLQTLFSTYEIDCRHKISMGRGIVTSCFGYQRALR